MEPTPELVDAIYRERVLRARGLTLQRRIEIGAELSDLARQMMREAVRRENPAASEEKIRELIRDRLELARKLDDIPLPPSDSAA